MDGAPPEFKGREYIVELPRPMYLAALWEIWVSVDKEKIWSCTVITGPSDQVPELQAIWHERTPIVLSEEDAEIWINPRVPVKAAMELLRGAQSPPLKITEVVKSGISN